ncbi:hypothetical protein [Nocardiopsis valliformis]|uniref:hypothetical protein n=1 Tax=Nocardiopsis valliformis TaxID=239974 RepID=UPI000346F8C3|nr:hypothetical protein [Nocardiopsis valliformis]
MRGNTATAAASLTGLILALSACTAQSGENADEGSPVVYYTDYPVFDTPADLSSASDLVVEGIITGSEVQELDILAPPEEGLSAEEDPGLGAPDAPDEVLLVYTVHRVEVTSVLAGEAEVGQSIEVKTLGGTLDGVVYAEDDPAELDRGAPQVLFLSGEADGGTPFSLVSSTQGAYTLESDGSLEPVSVQNPVVISEDEAAEIFDLE